MMVGQILMRLQKNKMFGLKKERFIIEFDFILKRKNIVR